LIKRNDKVALYGRVGTYSDKISHWEVDVIFRRKDKYGERETIATNEQFGRDRSRCFRDEKMALSYYDELTAKLYQGVLKVISGVDQNAEVMPEYQPEGICNTVIKNRSIPRMFKLVRWEGYLQIQ
jgi:hypothetical protein